MDNKVIENAETEIPEIADDIDSKSHRVSIEDALRDSFDDAEKPPEERKYPLKSEAAKKRPRDDKGTFTPKDKEPKAVEAPIQAAPVEQVPTTTPTEKPVVSTAPEQAPSSWSTEAKAQWASIPPAVQQAALKREKEMSEGSVKYKADLQRYQEIDAVMAPRHTLLQQAGRTPAQAIDQMWRWHDMLSNPAYRDQALVQLARDYGITNFPSTGQQINQQQAVPNQHPTDITRFMAPVQQQVQSLAQTIEALQAKELKNEIASFANAKDQAGNLLRPHFEKAKSFMSKLLEKEIAPDLETAYQMAIRADKDVAAEIESEQKAKDDADRLAVAEKEKADKKTAEEAAAKKRAEQTSKARNAAVSPRGSAPIGSTAGAKKKMSVEDSLRAAMSEVDARV